MINDYGLEVVSVLALFGDPPPPEAKREGAYGLDVSGRILPCLRSPGTTLYFPPGRYFLATAPDAFGLLRTTEFVCEAGVELFFAVGAILRINDGVTLRIRGTIRAGRQQIFGFTHEEAAVFAGVDRPLAAHPEVVTWPRYPGAGRVIIESDAIPFGCPERRPRPPPHADGRPRPAWLS